MLLRTKLHHYSFPSDSHPGFKAMVKEIEANSEGRGHQMHAIPSRKADHYNHKGGEVEEVVLDSTHIFDNQWNETEGSGNRRLFDWYRAAVYHNGRELDACWGHWLEITPEMAKLRAETFKCGYCGKQYGPHHLPLPKSGFCTACIGSEYLEQERLYLLRLTRVVDSGPWRQLPVLTEEESKWLTPMYIEHQTLCAARRATEAHQKAKVKIEEEYNRGCREAEQKAQAVKDERDGKLWLWERGFNLSNVIYYGHTRQFAFGWCKPVSDDVRDKLLDVMREFPYAYTIKCDDGRTLESVSVKG